MKKLFKFSMLILALTLVLTACTVKKESNADTSWEYIKSKGEIIVGLDDTFAPMGFRDESNNIVGFDIDYAEALGKELGLKIKLQPIDWTAKELELSSKRIDVIWNGMSITSERQETMTLSKPYLNNTLVIMTKAGSTIKTKTDLIGKNVAVQDGSSGLEVVKKDSIYVEIEKSLQLTKDYDAAIMDLESGRVDAVIIDKVTAMYKATKKPNAYGIADQDFGEDLYAVGLRKEDKAFAAEFQKAMDKIAASGKGSEISKKWFGEDIVVK